MEAEGKQRLLIMVLHQVEVETDVRQIDNIETQTLLITICSCDKLSDKLSIVMCCEVTVMDTAVECKNKMNGAEFNCLIATVAAPNKHLIEATFAQPLIGTSLIQT